MKERYALYHGCLIPARAPFLEASTKKVLDDLDIKYEDLKGTSCCVDPTTLRGTSERAWLVLNARNIALAEERDLPILSQCNGCFSNINEANHALRDDGELTAVVNEDLSKVGREYKGSQDIHHLIGVLHGAGEDRIRKLVRQPLTDWVVASEPGCHLTRPSEHSPFPNNRYPRLIEDLATWVGASTVEYSDVILCCGNVVRRMDPGVADKMLGDLISAIAGAGATHIVTPCPTCYVQMDMGQKDVVGKIGIPAPLPVLFVSEMMALAFGHSPEELGFRYHRVPVDL
ncbi:MAG: CoB--CoM heterodisulfide reductase iron-sulfur subunit B family protein [Candidatus Thermoplasmatota archaeon]|nr:CoB--CoM heterodisulfide reductase iron-sulfur subunit B family protein [Candidatus Thermoplasmatota archaeon]